MSNSPNAPRLAHSLAEARAYWQTDAGRALWDAQRACLGPVVEGRKGGHSLEMGMAPPLMTMSGIVHQVVWAPSREAAHSESTLICPPEQLALPDRCLDVMVIHHWLEYLPDAHHTLQEAARVTADNGVLVLFGFNPVGLNGLSRRWRKAEYPWQGQWRTVNRLRDWLAFVDFEVERVDYCCFRGPMSTTCRERWERLGRRHNMPLGESYMIQAQRRQRHAPIQRVKFGLRTPVSSSIGATRTSAAARLPAGKRCIEKDSERE
ncbi:MAG: methyltransferase domain-containing protein [Halomonas sp.]|nr:methyltransferase domain-containing protein [Halomonas sp.]MDM7480459.1 methyltransferase domain-containing protein [Halomonas sp.]